MDLATSVTSRANVVEVREIRPGSCWLIWRKMQQDTRRAILLLRSPGAYWHSAVTKALRLLVALEAMTGVLAGGAFADQVSSKEAAPSAPEGTAHSHDRDRY